jgi:indolepyruvate decarboxylase
VRMSVGDFLLKRLAELGARYVFGVPGDYNLWFLEQAERSNQVEFVGCCNELNAAYAADGFARLSGFSALVTTYGVGELSAIAGVAGAYAERVPVVCIIGAPPLGAIEERALLHHTLGDGNLVNMLSSHRDFSVAQTRIEPANARWEIDRVLRSCWIEKRPVYLQLPSDVPAMTIEVPEEPPTYRSDQRSHPACSRDRADRHPHGRSRPPSHPPRRRCCPIWSDETDNEADRNSFHTVCDAPSRQGPDR